jgi:hypothetical protein
MRSLGASLLLVLAAASPARAELWADLAADQQAITRLEGARVQTEARRAALEQQSQALGSDIERLKGETAGVRRDLKLQSQLAAQKAKSDELERVAVELRAGVAAVGAARRKLIADCDRALALPALPEAKRLELTRLRAAQAAVLALPDRPLGVARAAADPLDGPRELQDKADLLRDSGDKLRREVQRLAQRIDSVERRRHLRERAGAIDEDLFGESISNRRSARLASSVGSSPTRGNSGESAPPPSSPAPTPPGGGGGTGVAGPGPGGGGAPPPGNGAGGGGSSPSVPTAPPMLPPTANDPATVLRNLVDPATLDELRRSDGGDDLDRQLRALRRVQGELEGLAKELDRRARDLTTRADELKHRK